MNSIKFDEDDPFDIGEKSECVSISKKSYKRNHTEIETMLREKSPRHEELSPIMEIRNSGFQGIKSIEKFPKMLNNANNENKISSSNNLGIDMNKTKKRQSWMSDNEDPSPFKLLTENQATNRSAKVVSIRDTLASKAMPPVGKVFAVDKLKSSFTNKLLGAIGNKMNSNMNIKAKQSDSDRLKPLDTNTEPFQLMPTFNKLSKLV